MIRSDLGENYRLPVALTVPIFGLGAVIGTVNNRPPPPQATLSCIKSSLSIGPP